MLFSPSQIVGLIEIDALDSTGPDCLVALGGEEESLAGLLTWLTGQSVAPADKLDDFAGPPCPVHRLSGMFAAPAAARVTADLDQLQSDLAAAADRLRLELAVAAAGFARSLKS
jgi:hypothetical protein